MRATAASCARTAREAHWSGLMREALGGDGSAYARFLRELVPVVRGIVRARGRGLGPEACEDVVQDVLLALHAKRHTWRTEAPILPWIYAIVRYKVADAFRARGCRVQIPVEDLADILAAPDGPDSTEREDALRLIGALEGRSAEVVRAMALDGAGVAETGARLSVSEGAVRVALHRGLKQLAALRGKMIETERRRSVGPLGLASSRHPNSRDRKRN
jgi:RNA polymerase sigma factor (sigma-70 family)